MRLGMGGNQGALGSFLEAPQSLPEARFPRSSALQQRLLSFKTQPGRKAPAGLIKKDYGSALRLPQWGHTRN